MIPIKRKLLYIFMDSLLRLRITWNQGTLLTVSVGYHVARTDSRGRVSWDDCRCRKIENMDRIFYIKLNKFSIRILDKRRDDLETVPH